MGNVFLKWSALLIVVGFTSLALAAPTKQSTSWPTDAVFRYKNIDGATVISSTLPEEALYRGYDVLDGKGHVVETVKPGLTKEERERLKDQEEKMQNQLKHDQYLVRMYITADGARRTRDRQIDALKLKINYTQNDLSRQRKKRDEQVSKAASFEKRGKDVPADVNDLLKFYSQQMEGTQQQLNEYEAEIDSINEKFEPIIDRLEVLSSNKN